MPEVTTITPEFQTVLFDDFSAHSIGSWSEELIAARETHYIRFERNRGGWDEISTYHTDALPNIGIEWIVKDDGNSHVLCQTGLNIEGVLDWRNWVRRHVLRRDIAPMLFFPALLTGDQRWRNYHVETEVRPLAGDGLCGIVLRAANAMQHYIFAVARGKAHLILRNFGETRTLATRRWKAAPYESAILGCGAEGSRISCSINGKELFQVDDRHYELGRCGVLANCPAEFRKFSVYMKRCDIDGHLEDKKKAISRAVAIKNRHPRPQLLQRTPLPAPCSGRSIRFGSLSDAGALDYLLVEQRGPEAPDFGIVCMTAVDSRGKILWQRGRPDGTKRNVPCDVGVQIYDIDGDGSNEVICGFDGRLQVLDGSSGKTKISTSAPVPDSADDGNRQFHFDSIFICNLSGGARASDILVKDVYRNIYAYDKDLRLLWHRNLNTGHYPLALDVNEDGRDEVLIGYTMLNAFGEELWKLRLNDHADAVSLIKSKRTGSYLAAIAASNEGFILADMDGRITNHLKIGHMQTVTATALIPDSDEWQIAANTYWGNPGVIYILSLDGDIINVFQPSLLGSPLSPVRWTREERDFLLLSAAAGTEGGLYDASGDQIAEFPDDGHPELCYFVGDFDCDGLDEIACWNHEELWVYRSEESATTGIRKPMRLPSFYNQSNYRATITAGWA